MTELFRMRIASKRQLTVPQRLMEALDLVEGDELRLTVRDGRIVSAEALKSVPAHLITADVAELLEARRREIEAGKVDNPDILTSRGGSAAAGSGDLSATAAFRDLFVQQLKDLYDAEQRLTDALRKMAEAASSPELKQALETHLRETEEHVARLEEVFRRSDIEPERQNSHAVKEFIAGAESMLQAKGDPAVKDAAIIALAQRLAHYAIAAYRTVRSFAHHLGLPLAAAQLQQSLEEEKAADEKLNQIAESSVIRQTSSVPVEAN